jgi:hypothetical protein
VHSAHTNTPDDDVIKSVKEAIEENIVYQRNTSLLLKPKLTRDEISTGLVQALINAIYSHSDSSLPFWSHVTYRPEIETYWRKDSNNFILRGAPDYLIRTSLPLPTFIPTQDIKPLPEDRPIYTPVNLQLFRRSFDTIDIFGGFRLGSKRPYPHTQIIVDVRAFNNRDQLMAIASRAQFGLTSAHAITMELYRQRDRYPIKMPEVLDPPVTLQCVVTDGRIFAFACYQLNSLDLDQGEMPNVLWVHGPLALYETLDKENGAVGVSQDCVGLLKAFLLNPLVEYSCNRQVQGNEQKDST